MTKNLLLGVLLVIGLNSGYAQPVIENPNLTMNPDNVLRATLNFTTDMPTEALAILQNDKHTITVPSTQGMTTEHEMNILGLHPEQTYAVTISVVDAMAQTAHDHSLTLETQSLPEDFPPLEVTISEPDKMQPGIILFNIMRWTPAQDPNWGVFIGVDEQGKVVWYHQGNARLRAVTQIGNQNLLYISEGDATEMDFLGRKIHQWGPSNLTIEEQIHHDIIDMPSGNLLGLSFDFRPLEDYVDENGEELATSIRGDAIVEFTPEGEVVNQWSVFDMLDSSRIIYPNQILQPAKALNWTHGNSVFYDEKEDSITVSLRMQDWVIKFDRATGELIWRFGADGDFLMKGEGEWQLYQHSAKLLSDGSLILYDNGSNRPGLDDPNDWYTRVVKYQLDTSSDDPKQWATTQSWEFRGREDYYAPFVGEIDPLANGNFLISNGGIVDNPELDLRDENNLKSVSIVEVTSDDSQKWFLS
jgi:arylsulfate sulfotransferase